MSIWAWGGVHLYACVFAGMSGRCDVKDMWGLRLGPLACNVVEGLAFAPTPSFRVFFVHWVLCFPFRAILKTEGLGRHTAGSNSCWVEVTAPFAEHSAPRPG